MKARRALVGFWSAALAALLLAACQSTPALGPNEAECPVCKHEGDLACLCVEIEPDTPSCECAGKTYYFCSDSCREEFLAHPERYTDE